MAPRSSRKTAQSSTAPHTTDNCQASTSQPSAGLADSGYLSPASQPEDNDFQSLDILGQRVNKLVTAINQLESLGIDKQFDLPLPKIVVVGEQSAGKSSQIEALSEIKVPRAGGGACTRCVLHISLRTGVTAEWSCKIDLQKHYYYDPRHVVDTLSRDDLGPWHRNDTPDIVPFATITDKDDLDIYLKRAQRALLNPGKDAANFLKIPSTDFTNQTDFDYQVVETMFSPNVIHLEITAANLPSLSFYDLPGIISHWDDDREAHIPELIRTLVEMYAAEENTIVLLAFPATTDVVVSQSGALMKEIGALDRTVGVMTKPDRLQESDDIGQWTKILSGRGGSFRLGHGCYVTRQPNPTELARNISTVEARRIEADFFTKQGPWNGGLSQYKNQFGTDRLRNHLSGLLSQQISKVLPDITDTINANLFEVENRLRDLPKPQAENSYSIVCTLVERFSSTLGDAFAGNGRFADEDNISSVWKAAVETLRNSVQASKPVVVVRSLNPEPEWEKFVNSRARPIEIDDAEAPPANSKKRPMEPPVTPAKRPRHNASSTPTPTPTPGSKSSTYPNPNKSRRVRDRDEADGYDSPPGIGQRYSLEDLQTMLNRMTSSNVVGEVDYKAKEKLMTRSMGHWNIILNDYIHETIHIIQNLIQSVLDEHLRVHTNTRLDCDMRNAAQQFIAQLSTRVQEKLHEALAVELHKPTTFNSETRRLYKDRELRHILDQRCRKRAMHFVSYTNQIDERSEAQAFQKKVNEVLLSKSVLGDDPYQREIDAISDVRAYYFVAADGFIDNIAKITEYHLFGSCRDQLVESIRKALRLHSEDGFEFAKVLLAEDAEREELRHRLQGQRKKLLAARRSLQGLGEEDVKMKDSDAYEDVA